MGYSPSCATTKPAGQRLRSPKLIELRPKSTRSHRRKLIILDHDDSIPFTSYGDDNRSSSPSPSPSPNTPAAASAITPGGPSRTLSTSSELSVFDGSVAFDAALYNNHAAGIIERTQTTARDMVISSSAASSSLSSYWSLETTDNAIKDMSLSCSAAAAAPMRRTSSRLAQKNGEYRMPGNSSSNKVVVVYIVYLILQYSYYIYSKTSQNNPLRFYHL